METKKKVRKSAGLRHTENEARAMLGIVALMRRAHGLTTQQQLERARRRVKRLLAANEPNYGS